jgi:uncharacterized membrane protein YdjX (TVP38/TMEM64 family)
MPITITRQRASAWAFLALCVVLAILAIVFRKEVSVLLDWVRGLGFVGHIVLISCLCVVALPVAAGYTPLCIGAGILWGFWVGYLTAWIGTCLLGPPIGFWACALLWRPQITRWLYGEAPSSTPLNSPDGSEQRDSPDENAIVVETESDGSGDEDVAVAPDDLDLGDGLGTPGPPMSDRRKKALAFLAAVQQKGFVVVLMLRNTPIPYGLQNALFSISGISFFKFWVASIVGQMPELAAWVYLGSTFQKISQLGGKVSTIEIVVIVVEVVVCVLVVVFLTWLGKRALRNPGEDTRAPLL